MSLNLSIFDRKNSNIANNSYIPIVLIIIATAIIAQVFYNFFVLKYFHLTHNIFWMLSAALKTMIFVIMWLTYEKNPTINQHIGFGYLVVLILGFFHLINYQITDVLTDDLALIFILIAKIFESLIFLMLATDSFRLRVGKWVGLLITSIVCLSIIFIIYNFSYILSEILSVMGEVSEIRSCNSISTFILLFCLYMLKDKRNNPSEDNNVLIYGWIYVAIIIGIASNLCFFLNAEPYNYFFTLGHLLGLVSMYFVFKGIFVSAINYPYEKLEKKSKEMMAILNRLPQAVTTYDQNLKLTFANKKARELLAYNLKDLLGLNRKQVVKKMYQGEENNHNLVDEVVNQNMINKVRTLKNGLGKEVKVELKAYDLSEGGYLYIFEKAKKKQSLDYIQLQTITILNSITNPLIVIDKKGDVIVCNKAMANVVEMNIKDVLGKNVSDINKKISYTPDIGSIRALEGETSSSPYKANLVTPNGNKKTILQQHAPICNIEGEIIGAIGISSDITEIKKENEIQRQNEKMILLGQMAAGIVHEVKNPLTTVIGFSNFIEQKTKEEQTKEYAKLIAREGKELNKIVTDFLSFAKPRKPVFKEASLNEIITSMQLIIDSNTVNKGIEVNYNLAENDVKIMADENQIKQVVLNIVQNAIDAMKKTKNPQLNIVTGFKEKTEEKYLSVNNNGSVIPREDLEKVGTPFFTKKEKGTGLGLSICLQILKEHEGRIDISSTEELGTTFTLVFPCATVS